jgi:hypothetical protein
MPPTSFALQALAYWDRSTDSCRARGHSESSRPSGRPLRSGVGGSKALTVRGRRPDRRAKDEVRYKPARVQAYGADAFGYKRGGQLDWERYCAAMVYRRLTPQGPFIRPGRGRMPLQSRVPSTCEDSSLTTESTAAERSNVPSQSA